MPFVVKESGKENMQRGSFGVAFVIGNAQIFTRCLAVISMRNIASLTTLVYLLAFAAPFDT